MSYVKRDDFHLFSYKLGQTIMKLDCSSIVHGPFFSSVEAFLFYHGKLLEASSLLEMFAPAKMNFQQHCYIFSLTVLGPFPK